MVEVQCACGTKLRLGDEWAGKKGRCPKCAGVLDIPALGEPERAQDTFDIPPVAPPVAHDDLPPVAPANAASVTDRRAASPSRTLPARPTKSPAVPASSSAVRHPPAAPPPISNAGSAPIATAKVAGANRSNRTWNIGGVAITPIHGVIVAGALILLAVIALMVSGGRSANVAKSSSTVPLTPDEPPLLPSVPSVPSTRPVTTKDARVDVAVPPNPASVSTPKKTPAAPSRDTTEVAVNVASSASQTPTPSVETVANSVTATNTPATSASKTKRATTGSRPVPGLSGVARQYDDFDCRRIQQEFGFRIPPEATILEINGTRLPLENLADLQASSAPLLFLPAGTHYLRLRPGDGLVEVKQEKHFADMYVAMRKFFHVGDVVNDEELFVRGARAMDVHSAPFLLNFMGASYAAKNQWDAAERKFRRSLRVNPAFAPAHLNLAHCLARAKKMKEAEQELALAEMFNVGNVFGLTPAIVAARREFRLPLETTAIITFSAQTYVSLESATAEDERLVGLLLAISKYAVREEERAKVLNNLGVHFSDSSKPELALEHFRLALDALKFAGPERFELARKILATMTSACRKAGFSEADEYARMQNAVSP